MIRKLGLAVLFLALGSVTALAADFNGKWTAQMQGRNGPQTITFAFTVTGSTVTGKVTTQRGDADISDGKVDGDNITFSQTMSMGGNDMKITYTGKADGADSIKFTRAMAMPAGAGGGGGGGNAGGGGGGGGRGGPTEFTATRAK